MVLDGSSSNEKLQAKVFQCLGSWLILDVIPQQHLIASKLLSLVFLALVNDITTTTVFGLTAVFAG